MLAGSEGGGGGTDEVFQPIKELDKHSPAILLLKILLFNNHIKQLPLLRHLKHEIHRIPLIKRFLQHQDILVIHTHQYTHLLLERLRLALALEDLHGDELAGRFVGGFVDGGKVARAEERAEGVGFREAAGEAVLGVAEYKDVCGVDFNVVAVLETTAFVAAD